MNKEEAKEYIGKVHIGHLATIGLDNKPRVRPVGASIFYGDDVSQRFRHFIIFYV